MVSRPRTWIELSAKALRHNLQATQRLIGPNVSILPIVKANAYGHGVSEIVSALPKQYRWLGVAYGEEALSLRLPGTRQRVVVLSYWRQSELAKLIRHNCELAVWDQPSLRALEKLPPSLRQQAKIHVKLDTGTSRIGFTSVTPSLVSRLSAFKIVGVFSHFATAEDRQLLPTQQQIQRFTTLSKPWAHQRGIVRHIACTAAALRLPEARFGAIRLGIGLYGLWPSVATRAEIRAQYRWFTMEPVLSWYSQVSQVKTVTAGTSIGYGRSLTVKRPTLVGTIPVGYADGYDRRLSNCGWVMVRGHRAPILGRICMNLMMVDLSAVPRAKVGETVTLLGPGMTADTMADLCGTINYEITTRLHPAIPRILR